MRKLALLLSFLAFAAAPALGEAPAVLLSKHEDGIGIKMRRTPKGMELEVTGAPEGIEPEAFALRTPSQLIIDLPMSIDREYRHIPISHPDVYSLRYGARKGKTRLILDFRSNESPQFQILAPTKDAPVRIRFASKNLIRDEIATAKPAAKIAEKPAETLEVKAVPAAKTEQPAAEKIEVAPAQDAERLVRRLPPRLIEAEDPAEALSPLMMLIFASSLLSLGGVLYLHRKKYGAHAAAKKPINPFEDLEYCYALLGVSSEASFSEVKSSYRQLAKRYHSDRLVAAGGNIVQIRSAEAQFHKLQQAYERIKAARGLK